MQRLEQLIEQKMQSLHFSKLEEFAAFARIGRATMFNLLKKPASTPNLQTLFKLEQALDKPIAELAELYRPESQSRAEILAAQRGKYRTEGRNLVTELLEQRQAERAR